MSLKTHTSAELSNRFQHCRGKHHCHVLCRIQTDMAIEKATEILQDREHEKALTPTACLLLLLSRTMSHVCVLIDSSVYVDQTVVMIHRWPTCQRRCTTTGFLYNIADTTWGSFFSRNNGLSIEIHILPCRKWNYNTSFDAYFQQHECCFVVYI